MTRKFLSFFLLLTAFVISHSTSAQFFLPPLPYAPNALEPHIDKQTMEIHHDKHHATYVQKLNEEVNKSKELQDKTLEEICKKAGKYSKSVRDNAGGHYNHSLFWSIMSPQGGRPSTELLDDITATFGSFDKFKTIFADSAKSRFGSGWAWLIVCPKGKLKITTTPNQNNPLMDVAAEAGTPILALDVWEHAYYLKYQNNRPDYISAFWNVVNWNEVNKRYAEIKKK